MDKLIDADTKFKASTSSTPTSEKLSIVKAKSIPHVISIERIPGTSTGDGQGVGRVQSMPREISIDSTPKSIGTLSTRRYVNNKLKFVNAKPDDEITEMRVLLSIQQTLKSMDDRLKKLESRKMSSAADSIEEQLSNLVALPLKTPADLNSLEFDLVNNKDLKHRFTEFVDSIGGKPAKDNMSRILARIFSNELATQYSWLGRRGNKKLEKLESTSIIKTVVMRAHQVKEDDVELFYSEWFRHAGQRFKREIKE